MSFDWQTTYAAALAAFQCEPPSAQLEADILTQFQAHPQAVINAIAKVTKQYQAGTIRSPWGVLKLEIPKQIRADITADSSHNERRRIERADQWLRNAGRHYPTWAEVEDELFNDRGLLNGRDDLRDRVRTRWEALTNDAIAA